MGHTAGKDIYRALGDRIDTLGTRAPWNDQLFAILKELYSEAEAELVVKMRSGLSTLEQVATATGLSPVELQPRLEALAEKGLVADICVKDTFYYLPSPMIVGIFEFTMMRTRGELNSKAWAELFHAYLSDSDEFWEANDGGISPMRALPHEQAMLPDAYTEVLDYEKAKEIVDQHDRWSIGICSCRHEKHHLGLKQCDIPLESCTSFGYSADYLIRRGFAREASRQEMLDQIDRSWEAGLVLNADNVQKRTTFICHCCACCCNALAGISRHGYPTAVVTSSYIARTDLTACTGCKNCFTDCPIDAIEMQPSTDKRFKKFGYPVVNQELCLGCGVCTRRCKSGSLKLVQREQRVFHPATTFERVILQSLSRGTLEHQIFDDPTSKTQAFMRGVVGGFLRLDPVKKALMSDTLRSRFLSTLKKGVVMQGKDWLRDFWRG